MIFIVDDDRSVRLSLARLLRSAGYQARAFAGAEEFLDHFDQASIPGSCVILDLLGTDLNGLLLQEIIDRSKPPVPVIVLSASVDAEVRAKMLAAGAASVLRKPCDSTVLLQAVADVLGQPPPAPSRAPTRALTHAPIRAPLENSPRHTLRRSGEFDSGRIRWDDLDNFVMEEGSGVYRPAGSVSFEQAVCLVRAAISAARTNQVRSLLVDTRALTGFASPDTFERFLAAVEWAKEAQSGMYLAMVARAEMIDPQKFGVLVALNRGMISNIFTTEVDARSWLAARDHR